MEIKTQNLPRMSREQLYKLLFQKDISAGDREKVKNELVKREADILYNQAQRARPGEVPQNGPTRPASKPASSPVSPKKRFLRPVVYIALVFLVIFLTYLIYSAAIR